MDPRLLDYYNRELQYFRHMAGEFATQFPKVASRLNMTGIDIADPYVERLLEGVSFLTARVQLKLDAEFPRFSQRLLEVVYPNYLAPTPATAIVRLEPRLFESTLAEGFTLPRNSVLRSQPIRSEEVICEFRTTQDVALWPLSIERVEFTGPPPDLPLARLPLPGTVKSALRITLATAADLPMARLALDDLTFFLSGADEVATRLYELLFTRCLGVVAGAERVDGASPRLLLPTALRPQGFDDAQALFPCPSTAFRGYRLLHEYFAFPPRYLFFAIGDLARSVKATSGSTMTLTVLFDAAASDLERVVDASGLSLFCTPAVNLFTKRADRVPVSGQRFEYHLVPDRAAPLDYEVHSVLRVAGHVAGGVADERVFKPFYQTLGEDGDEYGAYYSVRREPRMMSDTARRNGTRTGYVGSEVYLSLVDQHDAPFGAELRQLSVDTLCTNRDLALLLQVGGATDFYLTASAPVDAIRIVRGPSRPSPAIAERDITWRLISHLSLNYVTLTDLGDTAGAAALRELLQLYAALSENAVRSHIDGVTRVALAPVTRRLPQTGPLAFGRGVEISLTVDETAFAGFSPYVLASVLESFFARHVSINTFTQTVLQSVQRGRIATWAPRIGRRPTA
ncbi:MAG: type VI secretion system baseplate subunit TssF [Rudaea sp.]